MLYHVYEAQAAVLRQSQFLAGLTGLWMNAPWPWGERPDAFKQFAAACELVERTGITHQRPAYAIDRSRLGNRLVEVREEVVETTPFATLLRFVKHDGGRAVGEGQPKLLVVAPLSGHFATLLRGTVRGLLPDNDVYITDWHNARDVPASAGAFGLDDCVAHIMRFLETLGAGSHVLAVCQPAAPVLVAVAVMAQSGSRAQPRSMTLMAGPIDTRITPTKVNVLAKEKSIDWFERNLISTVPIGLAGAGRRVYPGFMQLTAFMAMNPQRHTKAHLDYYNHLAQGRADAATAHRAFYDEYMAVMDLPAEFFLQTVRSVFQDHDLPRGKTRWRGQTVDPGAIRRTALFAVEGEMDDICAIGQTMAALDLCVGLRPAMKRYHLQSGVGHYGVFNGRRWLAEIYPRVRTMIQAHSS